MKAPDPPQIQPDPLLQQQEQQAQKDKIAALQQTAQIDTSNLMARYGALAGYAAKG